MKDIITLQFLTLCVYAFFVGFVFCDGFKLHILLKLLWFLTFLYVSISVLMSEWSFELTRILPATTLMAILLCALQKQLHKRNAG